MRNFEIKYATSEQVAEIERFANDGHADALIAFGKDCVHAFKKDVGTWCLVGLGVGAVVGIAGTVINALRKKWQKELYVFEASLENGCDVTEEES